MSSRDNLKRLRALRNSVINEPLDAAHHYHYDNEKAEDWEERWSESYERVFYKNTMTGQKVWERPEIMGPLPEYDDYVPPVDRSVVYTFVDRSTGRRVSVSKTDQYSSPPPDSRQPFGDANYGYDEKQSISSFEVVSPAGKRLSITKSDPNAPDVHPPFHKPIEIIVMHEVCPDTGEIIQVHDHVYFDEKSGPTEDELNELHEQENQQLFEEEQQRLLNEKKQGYKKSGSAAAKLFASFDDYHDDDGINNDSTIYDDVDLTTPYANKSRNSITTPERAMGAPAPPLLGTPKQSSLKKAGSTGKGSGKEVSFREPRDSDVRYLEREPRCKVADCVLS